jgi:hypothetical protein
VGVEVVVELEIVVVVGVEVVVELEIVVVVEFVIRMLVG